MSRRTRRRRPRRAEPAPVLVAEPRALTEVERDRLRQRYANMRGRSIVVGWESLRIKVEASTPEELAAKTAAILIERAKRQPPS